METLVFTLQRLFFYSITGLVAGVSITLFLFSLERVTQAQTDHSWLIYFLPAVGWIIGKIYELKPSSQKYAWLTVWSTTLLSHLTGASVGREGAAIEISESLTEKLFSRQNELFKKNIMTAGVCAGFAAAVGAPFTGTVFGLERIKAPFSLVQIIFCLISASIATFITRLLHAPHLTFSHPEEPTLALTSFFGLVIAGIFFGAVAFLFLKSEKTIEAVSTRFLPTLKWRTFAGGLLLLALYHLPNTDSYRGLGLISIMGSFYHVPPFEVPFLKLLFSVLAMGFGFRGGKFIPLVFIGCTLGSALSVFVPLPFSYLAACGFAAVFGAASATPLACSILIFEFFGPAAGVGGVVCCFVASALVTFLSKTGLLEKVKL